MSLRNKARFVDFASIALIAIAVLVPAAIGLAV